ncbi:DUF84 family protein [Barrientosiimonas marina]|uniref:inosine/xanthosine triphosphatase n=1 Tax=Lentibacillus kimchii TaxID=1542911 RepID=A0ABW2UVR4_9BACI
MKIVIGSKNSAKIAAVEENFTQADVSAADVPSFVNDQPFSDAETREGALNRAANSIKQTSADAAIGLEGGVMYVGDSLYLCNWGALVTKENRTFTASGARILLPEHIEKELINGRELGDVMDDYAERQNVRQKEGAIGVFTNEHLSRQDMFSQVINLLYGQWAFGQER